MEVAFFEWLLQQAGMAGIAGLALWFMQQNHSAYMERERENVATHREDKGRLLEALQKNTEASTKLVTAVAHLEQAIRDGNERNT